MAQQNSPLTTQTSAKKSIQIQPPNRRHLQVSSCQLPMSNEEAHWRGFMENGGVYLTAGTFYRRSTANRIHFVTFFLLEFLVITSTSMAVVNSKDDLAVMYETLYYTVLILGMITARFSSCFCQDSTTSLLTAMGKGLHEYTILDEGTAQEMNTLRSKGKKEKHVLRILLEGAGMVALFGYILGLPALAMYTGEYFEPQKSSGVIGGLPTYMWIPFKIDDKSIVWARILITFIYGLFGITLISLITGGMTLYICVGHTLWYEFQNDIPVATKMVFAVFTLIEFSDTFVFCYYGQMLLNANELIRNAAYECEWTRYSSVISKDLLILLTRLQKPLAQTAGGFTDVTLDSFTQVVKTSFSYFSLLQAVS